MEVNLILGAEHKFELSAGLLLYTDGSRSFATLHEVRKEPGGGAPYLAEGQPLTTAFLRTLAEGLGSRTRPEILPARVLVRTPDLLVWWSPAKHRPMFFSPHGDPDGTLNGKRFPHPALVFKVAGRELYVRALDANERPTATTPLKTAPYWNVGQDGRVCQGSMRAPDENSVASIEGWEHAFFRSEFTHVLGAVRLTKQPEGFLGLWRGLAGSRRRFPVEFLTDARQSLAEFVSEG